MSGTLSDISVVIPSYQRGTMLLDTLGRLLELPVQAREILVIDQTKEHSPHVMEALQALRDSGTIRRVVLERPSIPCAMNAGLREARGDVVLFLDDDIIPDRDLIRVHSESHRSRPDVWAVVGQVLQPEDDFQVSAHPSKSSTSALRRDIGFRFNGTAAAWVENVMAGNLSVKREKALQVGGFDENFIPPVSFRFETEFAKRVVTAGGRIRFAPEASLRHLRAGQGGTRCQGSHLTSISPLHGVGDYYYALLWGHGWGRIAYILKRPFRQVRTKFHLSHPWFIPGKFMGELRAVVLALRLYRNGARLLPRGEDP